MNVMSVLFIVFFLKKKILKNVIQPHLLYTKTDLKQGALLVID